MGLIGRNPPAGTSFPANRTAVSADMAEVAVLTCASVLLASLLLVAPGFRKRRRVVLGAVGSLFVGTVLLLAIFAPAWQRATATYARVQYAPASGLAVHARVGVHIGLHAVNVTLVGEPEYQHGQRINYNERFDWGEWDGEPGPGWRMQIARARRRGVPEPIVSVAEYFTTRATYMQWGKQYRYAGFYTHGVLWTAVCTWLLANMYWLARPATGALWTALTGALMLSGAVTWSAVRPSEFHIHVVGGGGGIDLEPRAAWAFHLLTVVGVLTTLTGALLYVMRLRATGDTPVWLPTGVARMVVTRTRTRRKHRALASTDDGDDDPVHAHALGAAPRSAPTPFGDEDDDAVRVEMAVQHRVAL